jgi:hypothetical protein
MARAPRAHYGGGCSCLVPVPLALEIHIYQSPKRHADCSQRNRPGMAPNKGAWHGRAPKCAQYCTKRGSKLKQDKYGKRFDFRLRTYFQNLSCLISHLTGAWEILWSRRNLKPPRARWEPTNGVLHRPLASPTRRPSGQPQVWPANDREAWCLRSYELQ